MRYTPPRASELTFVRRASEWVKRVLQRQRWELTDFLSPPEQVLLEQVANAGGAEVAFGGGTPHAERRRALIMPDNWYPEDEDFQVQALRVDGLDAADASHGSVLGSVLGTGLDRRKVGDVALVSGTAWVWVCADVVPYLLSEWRSVGRSQVRPAPDVGPPDWRGPAYERQLISVRSLRADAVLAQACRWSRERAQGAIESGAVSLNFAEFAKPDEPVTEGDVLSVRGFGRVKVLSVVGWSKRDRQRVEVGVLRSR
ncbi:MAG: hypothetical protein K6T30_08205 [Alicyclobacillus sp.]|nr:hypothetical protein [Alicyclobacillus sp.]